MKNNLIVLRLLAAVPICLIFAATSCSFLDLEPIDSLTPEGFYQNASEAEKALNGVYQALTLQGGSDLILNNEVMTDNCVYSSASGSEWMAFTRGTLNPSTSQVESKWVNNYKGIARANLLIYHLENDTAIVISEANRVRDLAEARFLRAYFYSDLLEYYGGVPLIMEPKDDIKSHNLPRSTVQEVLDTILCDLNYAISILEDKPAANFNGRATRGAALFLKGRVLLYHRHYAEAYAALNRIDELGQYQLLPIYADIFSPMNENNAEVIFDIQYADAANTSSSYPFYKYIKEWKGGYIPTASLAESFYDLRGNPVPCPPKKFADFFANRDKRLATTLITPLENYGDGVYTPTANDKQYYSSCMRVHKYLVFSDVTNSDKRATLNVILFRYADVKLMEAECIIENDSLYNANRRRAITLLDEIRNRAGLPAVEEVIASPDRDQLREIMRRERRCELAFEGSRLRDIRRWQIMEEVIPGEAYGYDPEMYALKTWAVYPVDQNRAFFPHQYLWPIPQSERDANPNCTQNPGY